MIHGDVNFWRLFIVYIECVSVYFKETYKVRKMLFCVGGFI